MRKGTRGTPEARLVNRLAQLKRSMPPEEFARLVEAGGSLKWCGGCKRLLLPANFHKSRGELDGLVNRCKTCCNATVTASRRRRLEEDPEYRSLLNQRSAASRARARADGRLQVTQRKQSLKAKGLTLEAFDARLAAQGRRCDICRKPFKNAKGTHVDHDHSCCPGDKSCGKCVRGILCGECNTGLGKFNDSPALLRRAARWLELDRAQRNGATGLDCGQGILWDDSGAA